VAERCATHHDLGVTTFLIRGFDPPDDAIEYGRSLLPTRQLIDERPGWLNTAPEPFSGASGTQ
jgi:alkanesulfonate monooxygenase